MARQERPRKRAPAELAAIEQARARDRLRMVPAPRALEALPEPSPARQGEELTEEEQWALAASCLPQRWPNRGHWIEFRQTDLFAEVLHFLDLLCNLNDKTPWRDLVRLQRRWKSWDNPRNVGLEQRIRRWCSSRFLKQWMICNPIYRTDEWVEFKSLYRRGWELFTAPGKAYRKKKNHEAYLRRVARGLTEEEILSHRKSNAAYSKRKRADDRETKLHKLEQIRTPRSRSLGFR